MTRSRGVRFPRVVEVVSWGGWGWRGAQRQLRAETAARRSHAVHSSSVRTANAPVCVVFTYLRSVYCVGFDMLISGWWYGSVVIWVEFFTDIVLWDWCVFKLNRQVCDFYWCLFNNHYIQYLLTVLTVYKKSYLNIALRLKIL